MRTRTVLIRVLASAIGALSVFITHGTMDAQSEKALATHHQGVNYEIVLYVDDSANDPYQVSTLKDKSKKRKLVEMESEYFKTTLDSLFSKLSADTDSARRILDAVGEALFESVTKYLVNRTIATRLETVDEGTAIGTLYLESDSTGVISSNDNDIAYRYHFVADTQAAIGSSTDSTRNRFGGKDPIVYVNPFKVSTVEISFEGGLASDIQVSGTYFRDSVTTELVQYRNHSPIPLGSPAEIDKFNSGRYLLFAQMSECDRRGMCSTFTSAIDPSWVVRFHRQVVGAGTYVPQDAVVKITTEDTSKSVSLRKHSFIRNFDARIYSDVTGLERDNPNGVLQVEIKYEHVFNTKLLHAFKKTWRSSVLMNRIAPFVIFPKLQDKLSSLRVDTVQSLVSTSVDTMLMVDGMLVDTTIAVLSKRLSGLTTTPIDAIRYANLHLGIGVHLFDYLHLKNRFSIGLNLGLYRTRVDTLSLTDHGISPSAFDEVNVTLERRDALFYYIEPRASASFIESRKFSFEILGSFMVWRPFGRTEDNVTMVGRTVLKLLANVNVHPTGGSREQSVFFRASVLKALNDLGDNPSSNLTLQIGYSTPISKIFGAN